MKVKCPNCQTELRYVKSIKSLLCNDCGFTLSVKEEPELPNQPNLVFKKYELLNSNSSRFILLGALFLIALGIFGLVTRSRSPNTPQTENTITGSTAQAINMKPETQAAISELKGINSKLDIGMNMTDYAEALRNANALVDRAFEADPQFKNNETIAKIMDGHLAALKLWRCNIKDTQYNSFAQDECRTTVYDTVIFPLYPEIKASVEPNKSPFVYGKYYYPVDNDKVLQLIWLLIEKDINSLETSK